MKIRNKINVVNNDLTISEKKIFNSKILLISFVINLIFFSFILLCFNNQRFAKKSFSIINHKIVVIDTFVMEVPVIYREKDLVALPRDIIHSNKNIAKSANNPGCIRPGNPSIDRLAIGFIEGVHGKYLAFATKEHGYEALSLWIDQFCIKNPKGDVEKLISKFAPEIENDTKSYINNIILKTPLTYNSGVKDILKHKASLIRVISQIEGFI